MIDSVKGSLMKYAEFQGKAKRKEFWLFVLFMNILQLVVGFIDALLGVDIFLNLMFFVIFLPYLAVAVRRMHDVGKRGWYILIPIYNFILCCTASIEESPQSYE